MPTGVYEETRDCHNIIGWTDVKGNSCSFYELNPRMCNDARIYSQNGIDANSACCICKKINNGPVPEEASDADPFHSKEQNFKPCPENELWGDMGNGISGTYMETGTGVCPAGHRCNKHGFSWKSGKYNLIMKGSENGTREGCWRKVNNEEKQSIYTCTEDDYCKNIDIENSKPGEIVYKCPDATCNLGNCFCGPGCKKDPITQICIPESTSGNDRLATPIKRNLNVQKGKPVPTPPVGICVPTEIDDGTVCWKREQKIDRFGNVEQYLVDCDPSMCGLDHLVPLGKKNIGGSMITVYPTKVENFYEKRDQMAPPFKELKAPPVSAPISHSDSKDLDSGTIAIIVIFSILGALVIGLGLVKIFKPPECSSKGGRRMGFG